MSALAKIIPKDKRLRISARYEHETLQFQGNIFEFIQYLVDRRLVGKGTFRIRSAGEIYGLEFDARQLVSAVEDQNAIDAKLNPV